MMESIGQRISTLLLMCFFFPGLLWAQEEGAKPRPNLFKRLLNLIDTTSVRGIDPNYIEIPEKPWAFVLRSNLSQSFVNLRSETHEASPMKIRIRTTSNLTTSVGAWIGYRGYGLGYSIDLSGDKGSDFTTGVSNIFDLLFSNLNLAAMGGRYGLNLRIRTYQVGHSNLTAWTNDSRDPVIRDQSMDIAEPMKVRSVFADAYYMFNGKHFSYAAAYDQSAIQRRSAGSLVVGLMYHYSRVEYDSGENIDLLNIMHGVGQMKMWQGSLGAGYAYNWVPHKNWLISAMILPVITFYNRGKVFYYERDHPENEVSEEVHFVNSELTDNKIVPNFDTRLSVTYNRARYYLNAYGTYNSFRYSNNDGGSVQVGDWYAYFSWGLRF